LANGILRRVGASGDPQTTPFADGKAADRLVVE
jgi:hypothetical protein